MECLANPVASPLFYCKSNMILLQPRIFSEEVCTTWQTKKGSDGRYRYRVCIGKDETGKPKYKSFYGSTAKAARAAAEAYRTALGKGMDPAQSKATLATLYDNLIAAKTAKGIGAKESRPL